MTEVFTLKRFLYKCKAQLRSSALQDLDLGQGGAGQTWQARPLLQDHTMQND